MWIIDTEPGAGLGGLTFRVLPGTPRTLGRAPAADFVVDGPMVSRLHCVLRVDNTGVLEVEDLGSTNGTFVNERRVTRSVLVAGDCLRVGRVEMRVRRPEDSPAGPGTSDAG